MFVNDGEMLVNDGEMLVNDGEMSICSYTHFTIIDYSISPSLTSLLPSFAHLTITEKLHRLPFKFKYSFFALSFSKKRKRYIDYSSD